jgi:hypothetical protein
MIADFRLQIGMFLSRLSEMSEIRRRLVEIVPMNPASRNEPIGNRQLAISRGTIMKIRCLSLFLLLALLGTSTVAPAHQKNAKRPRGSICGNPKLPCKTTATFQPNDLPFRVPENSVIYDTELFYAVILKSARAKDDDCNVFISEDERLQAQASFPENKVFASRCVDIENLAYIGVNPNVRILAVYAGSTLADARRMLAAVNATGKYPGASIRRLRTGFNGT